MKVPYILPYELINESEGGVNWDKVYPRVGLTTEQKIMKVCREVTDTIDKICGGYAYNMTKKYMLGASEDTEVAYTDERMQAMIDTRGQLLFIATFRPIISVTAMRYSPVTVQALADMQTIDTDLVTFEGRDIKSTGLYSIYGGQPLKVAVTYINGFANTQLTSPVIASATTMTVDNVVGIAEGDTLEIMDDPAEGPTVLSIAGHVLTLSAGLAAAHAAGIRITAIPRDITRAAVYLAWDIAQAHAREAMAIAKLGLMGGDEIKGPTNFYKLAEDRLSPYILTP